MKKIKVKLKKVESCINCPDHKVILDSDPNDWFCDDMAVICTLAKNPNIEPNSKYSSDRQEFRKLTSSCRPYNLRKEATVPVWCPKKKKSTKKKVKENKS